MCSEPSFVARTWNKIASGDTKNNKTNVSSDSSKIYRQRLTLLMHEGKYSRALDEIIKYDSELYKHGAFFGVRNSFMLSTWKKLGESYPPALVKLKQMHDQKTAQLKSGNVTKVSLYNVAVSEYLKDPEANQRKINQKIAYIIFSDVQSINKTLDEADKTIKLFKYLSKHHPSLAKVCWKLAGNQIIEFEEYKTAKNWYKILSNTGSLNK